MLRVIKAAERLGFTLDEVADLLDVGRHRHDRHGRAGWQARAEAKLAELQARINDLEVIRDNLLAAVYAGCDDLLTCATTDDCPLPFATPATGDRVESRRVQRPPLPPSRHLVRGARLWGEVPAAGLRARLRMAHPRRGDRVFLTGIAATLMLGAPA